MPELTTATVSMVPLNDPAKLGVDWTLTCGGNAQIGYVTTGCGSLLPTHTASGVPATYTAPGAIPANNSVTIMARVTSDPSQASSVTLTIVNPAIIVTLGATPASMDVGQTITGITAIATNDLDTKGVHWTATCGSDPTLYGSFNPQDTQSTYPTAYTAPTAVPPCGTLTITAGSVADKSKMDTAKILILPIIVTVSPSTYNVTTSGAETLTAVVANDPQHAGVKWSCGFVGCGSFSSTQTLSGLSTTYTAPSSVPTGGTVTITATSANDGMTQNTAIAKISASAVINVSFTPPSSVEEGKTAALTATVTGDASSAGVDWTATCGSSVAGACGSFSSANTASGTGPTYTAPSALPPLNPVTITATSHAYNLNNSLLANPATGAITIGAPVSIAFTLQPAASVATNGTASVSANITNDAATGGGITWTVQCTNTADGACGYIQPYQTANGGTATYVAPPVSPGVPVYVKATSTSLASVWTLSNPISIVSSNTHSISFVPFVPSGMQVDTSVNLNAAVTNDPGNAGVDWSVCASGCGFFTTKVAIPAIAAVPPSAGDPGSPAVPAVDAVTATSVQGWPDGLPLPYTAPPVAPEGGVVITASSTADRLNNVASPATAVSTITISSDVTEPALHGVVQAGTQPVVGASVYLYAAGTSGYASASVPISSPAATSIIKTDSTGGFTIPAGYSCPKLTSQVYLVATGGQVGSAGLNSNLALMTALGPCSNLSSTTVVINEVTTVASAAALATFSADNIQTGELSYQYIGSSSANSTVGLANAFASVNNLVDITTGRPKFSTVAGNATVPYVTINTLADALNACAVTSGGAYRDGTDCGNLLAYADPMSGASSYAPTDTLQAIIDLLKPPSPTIHTQVLVSSVFGMASKSSPFQPILSSAPQTEWSLSLHYTSGGGVGGSGANASGSSALAVDASGNIWITNQSINSVSEWSSLGAAYSPNTSGFAPGGFTGGGVYAPTAVAVDPSGYVWIVNGNGTLTKLDSTGAAHSGSPYSGGGLLSTGNGIAIDGSGNVWVTSGGSPGSVAKFNSRGIAQSPSTGYTSGINEPTAIAIDGSGNVWVSNLQEPGRGAGNGDLAELNNGNGSLTILAEGTIGPPQLAVDKSGNVWGGNGGGLLETSVVYNGTVGTTFNTYSFTDDQFLNKPKGIAFDGSNRLWMASTALSQTLQPTNLSLFDSANVGEDGDYADSSFSNGAPSAAVDASGNVWVLTSNNTVAEYVGLAAPVVTPLSVGVKNNKLGTKP